MNPAINALVRTLINYPTTARHIRSPKFGWQFLRSLIAVANAWPQRRWSAGTKYLIRSICCPRTTFAWLDAIYNVAVLTTFAQSQPRLLVKPQRHYLNTLYAPRQRLDALLHHYKFIGGMLSRYEIITLASGNKLMLANVCGKKDSIYRIHLAQTDKFDREGELLLSLDNEDAEHMAVAAFTVIGQNEWTLKIGCLQGGAGKNSRELVKHATRNLYGMRPKNVLMNAVYILAETWGINCIACVGNSGQVYKSKSPKVFADYDSFWTELGGVKDQFGEFSLPKLQWHRPSAEIPSSRRAEYRRRVALRLDMKQQILDSLSRDTSSFNSIYPIRVYKQAYNVSIPSE